MFTGLKATQALKSATCFEHVFNFNIECSNKVPHLDFEENGEGEGEAELSVP